MRASFRCSIVVLGIAALLMGISRESAAIPPPDMLFTVGSQLLQTFAVVCVVLSAAFGASYRVMRAYFSTNRFAKLIVLAAVIIACSALIAYLIEVLS